MSEVSNQELLQAIKDLSGDVQESNRKLESLETRTTHMETEIKYDIRKLDQKFQLATKDLLEV